MQTNKFVTNDSPPQLNILIDLIGILDKSKHLLFVTSRLCFDHWLKIHVHSLMFLFLIPRSESYFNIREK